MARITVDVYTGYARHDVIVDIPTPHTRAGSWHGEIRARLVDDDTQDWFFEVQYRADGQQRIETFPVEWCRRPELTDLDGIVPPAHLDRMRAEQAGDTTPDPHSTCPACDCGSRGPVHCKHAHLAWG